MFSLQRGAVLKTKIHHKASNTALFDYMMIEPTMPVGATIAAFVMTVISWYGMLRTGVQLVHDDNERRKSVNEDIKDILADLEHQANGLRDWKGKWCISRKTSDVVLAQLWGPRRLRIIREKFERIKSHLQKAREKLGPLAQLADHDWMHENKFKRRYYTISFIWTKQKYVQELIERASNNIAVIKEESEDGWREQRQIRGREVACLTPYHIQVAHWLVRIAMQNLKDVDNLRSCCHFVQDDVTVLLDLDIFDTFSAENEDQHVERLTQAFDVGHLKLELLLREANREEGELKRVLVERVFDGLTPESRIVDAFRAILGTSECTPCFTADSSTLFRLSKHRRAKDSCATLPQSLRDVLADQDPPRYNAQIEQFSNQTTMLGKVSVAKAAFELAQACLLFLRTTWIQELCRCTVRCGVPYNTSTLQWHQFGFELGQTMHRPLFRRGHYQSPRSFHERPGNPEPSWCTQNNHWYGLMKPIRHLGLLLVEIFLGTIVLPQTNNEGNGADTVGNIHMIIEEQSSSSKWETFSLSKILRLIRQSFNDSDHVEAAIKYCLTNSFPSSLSDDEMEKHLRRFYFTVVKPYVSPDRSKALLIDYD